MSTLVSLFADSRKVRLVVFALMLVLFSFATSGFVFASNEEPPAPIIVIEEIEPNKDALRAAPDAVVPGPNGEKMTMVNRYFPYHLGAVKTDGWAEANFR